MAKQYFNSSLTSRLDRLSLRMREMARAQTGGSRRSRARGTSVEFADYREYSLGDDFRRIDWNAYGRLEKLYIKLFLEERESIVTPILDSSKSMNFGESIDKGDYARALCDVVSYLALRRQDSVRPCVLRGDSATTIDAVRGRESFLKVMDFFEVVQFGGTSSISAAVRTLNFKPGGVAVLVSDLFSQDDWKQALRYLRYKKQDVAVLHLLAAEEVSPDYEGRLLIVDSETGDARDVEINQQAREAYAHALSAFRMECKEACHAMGAIYIPLDTSLSFEDAVFGPVASSGLIG